MAKKKPNPKSRNPQESDSHRQQSKRQQSSTSQQPDISQKTPYVQRLLPSSPIPNNPPKRRRIAVLLSSPDQLSEIRELVTTGASLATIEAVMQWPPNTLVKLLDKGKVQKAGPYRQFYTMFRAWAGQARHRAEAALNAKSPEKWLDRSTTAKMVESENDRLLAQTAATNENNIAAKMGAESVMAAMRVLAEQGFDLNEAIRKDQIHLTNEPISIEQDNEDD